MKTKLIVVLFLSLGIQAQAQLDLKKAASTATALGFDPAKIGKSIMDTLTPKLGLSGGTVSQVSGLVNQFLTNKSGFMNLAQSKPTEYKSKLEGEQKTLFDGLKSSLTPTQMTQFMGMKPAKADASNAISQLFY